MIMAIQRLIYFDKRLTSGLNKYANTKATTNGTMTGIIKYNKNTAITIATTINKRRKKGSIGWFIIKGNPTIKSM